MANLETLELTISANAESATKGIESLTHSLSAMAKAVGKSINGLMRLNKELRELKGFANLKLPNFSEKAVAKKVVSSAKKATEEYIPRGMNVDAVNRGDPNAKPEAQWQKEYAENVKNQLLAHQQRIKQNNEYRQRIAEEARVAKEASEARGKEALSLLNNSDKIGLMSQKLQGMVASYAQEAQAGKLSQQEMIQRALQIKDYSEKLDKLKEATENASKATRDEASTLGKLKEGFSNALKGVTSFFSKIKRIATTMLIRSAIRGLIKSVKEGINNLYEWSKLNNGEFAKSMDTLKSKTQELKNSIGASIAPLIQALIPVLTNLANAAIEAFNWVNQLISLLSGKNSWTRAKQGADDFTDSAKKASGAAKEWLASFDELNVMTKDSGGGSSATTETDYSDMFEQVYKFDDTVRKIVDFIKENFESIKRIAIEIGGVIALWKIGTALAEALPLLSQIIGYVATAGVIAITVELTWLFANKFMKTGEDGWLWAEGLTTALGSTAAYAIAKQLIGGKAGIYAAAITLTFSAITGIVANISNTNVDAFSATSIKQNIIDALKMGAATGLILKATVGGALSGGWILAAAGGVALLTFGIVLGLKLLTSKKDMKWGSLELTQEQIEEYVKSNMFTAEANVYVEQIHVYLDKKKSLMDSITGKSTAISNELDIITLGIDKQASYENINKIINGDENGTGGLIQDISELCDVNIAMLKLNFATVTAYNGSGEVLSSDDLLVGINGWNKINAQMQLKGQELTKLLIQGAKGELTPEMEAYTQQLLEEVTTMTRKITSAQAFSKSVVDFKTAALDAMSKNSMDGILTAYKTYSKENEETIRQAWIETAQSYVALAELEDDPELKANYRRIADDILEGLDQTVEEELKKQNEPGRQLIMDWLANRYVDNEAYDAERLKKSIDVHGIVDAFDSLIYDTFSTTEINMFEAINITGWTALSERLRKGFLESVQLNENTIKELKTIGVPANELVKFIEWEKITQTESTEFVRAITNAYGASGITELKRRLPRISANDIVQVIDWDSFSSKEQFEFLNALKDSFGSEEALNAAKKAGIDVAKMVEEGMNSQDTDIRKAAEDWNSIINKGVEKEQPVVKPSLDTGTVTSISSMLKSGIERNTNPDVKVTASPKGNTIKNLEAIVEKSANPVITARAAVARNTLLDVYHQIADMTPDITVGIQKTSNFNAVLSEISNGVLSAFEQVFKATVNGSLVGTLSILPALATGGLVTSGDVFVANENGNSELIGRFGNQTGVANQMEIISGIEKGVADANREQNELLRAQNNLLRGILEKDNTVRIGASAALGRVTRQSLDMYSAVMG